MPLTPRLPTAGPLTPRLPTAEPKLEKRSATVQPRALAKGDASCDAAKAFHCGFGTAGGGILAADTLSTASEGECTSADLGALSSGCSAAATPSGSGASDASGSFTGGSSAGIGLDANAGSSCIISLGSAPQSCHNSPALPPHSLRGLLNGDSLAAVATVVVANPAPSGKEEQSRKSDEAPAREPTPGSGDNGRDPLVLPSVASRAQRPSVAASSPRDAESPTASASSVSPGRSRRQSRMSEDSNGSGSTGSGSAHSSSPRRRFKASEDLADRMARLRGRAEALARHAAEVVAWADAAAAQPPQHGFDPVVGCPGGNPGNACSPSGCFDDPSFSSSGSFSRQSGKSVGSLGRPSLAQVSEDSATELDCSVTFLLPMGEEGEEFMSAVLSAFPQVNFSSSNASICVTVPYGGGKTAMVSLQKLGPVEALQQVRQCASIMSQTNDSDVSGPQGNGLHLEPVGEVGAQSSALVYVVRPFNSAEDAEQQLGPICSVEALYRSADQRRQPRRFLAALYGGGEGNACYCSTKDGICEGPAELNIPGPFGKEVLRRLASRRVDPAPSCTAVRRNCIAEHEAFVKLIVQALASHFRPGQGGVGKALCRTDKVCEMSSTLSTDTTEAGSLRSSPGLTPQTTPAGIVYATAR